jgi:hypothetical protein
LNRRRFLKYAGVTAAALGASALGLDYARFSPMPNQTTSTFLTTSSSIRSTSVTTSIRSKVALSQIPVPVSAQGTPYTEIDVGSLQVPVDPFNGNVSEEKYYSDTFPYQLFIHKLMFDQSEKMEGQMRVKHSDFTYFGVDIPTATPDNKYAKNGSTLFFWFDTENNTNYFEHNAEGFYSLLLDSDSLQGQPYEKNSILGAPFKNRGKDYDWKYYFGPSKLNTTPHSQYEIKIATNILTKHSNEIRFTGGYVDANGQLTFFHSSLTGGGKMKFSQEVFVPEFPWLRYLLDGTIFSTLLLLMRQKKTK